MTAQLTLIKSIVGVLENGSFLDPAAITVSPDGRFILVADGYEDKSYLSAFLMEIDEHPD